MMNRALHRAVDTHRQLKAAAERRARIEHEREELRHQGYDTLMAPSATRPSGNVLRGVLTGAIGGAILGQILRGGFHHGPCPADRLWRRPAHPALDGFGTGGSFGGDEFKTGGSF